MRGGQIVENVLEVDWELLSCSFRSKKGALILFDFTAAFPSVNHEYLWATLGAAGIPHQVIRAYQHLYKENKHMIRLGGKDWESVNVTSGGQTRLPTQPDALPDCGLAAP